MTPVSRVTSPTTVAQPVAPGVPLDESLGEDAAAGAG
jgi:hypothetical protein